MLAWCQPEFSIIKLTCWLWNEVTLDDSISELECQQCIFHKKLLVKKSGNFSKSERSSEYYTAVYSQLSKGSKLQEFILMLKFNKLINAVCFRSSFLHKRTKRCQKFASINPIMTKLRPRVHCVWQSKMDDLAVEVRDTNGAFYKVKFLLFSKCAGLKYYRLYWRK